jgi:DNA-directed RNA polymerase specialized sigma24 family protein
MMAVSGEAESVEEQVDSGAFADFYRLELDAQVRRAVLLLGSSDIANDVVHDAFIAVYRRWDTLDEPGPYLHMAVLNGCRGG